MPTQEEHDEPENLVEAPHQGHTASSLQEAADSNATLEGYYAINNDKPSKEAEEQMDEEESRRNKSRS